MTRQPARYRCLSCLAEWEEAFNESLGRYPGPTQCPFCAHLYAKWLNFEELYG